MGVKGSCRSANRGGVSLPLCPFSIAPASILSLPSSSPVVNFQSIGANFQQNRAKVNFSLVCLVFSREFRRPKRAKFKIYLSFEGAGASVVALHLWRWWCPLVAGGALLLPLFGCVPSLSPCLLSLSCFACGALHLNMALFRVLRGFLEGFMVQMYVCMG